ncbi:Myosin-XVIIIb [Fasciolopsis buskii]|uniref:Myosin-XVIIIb n=1 Tax=Fasciolopsis buskii TaxID=27845 RepID=A0A8E0S2U7_9TREM|nr:Myosin-XVIIIb [Fasciolopsis buski]
MFTSVYFRLCLQLEDQLCTAKREKINLQTQIDDHLELMKETQRLHQSTLAARSVDATTIEAQTQEINELLKERDALRSQVDELQTKLSASDLKQVQRANNECLEAKIRELESRLDLEQNNRARLQASLDRSRETVQQLMTERDKLLTSENAERQQNRKLSRQLREAQQEQDETARRALQAQRRADEALTHADQAMRQATSSRVELNVMARRTQELEAWVNEHQLGYLLDDFHSSSLNRCRSTTGSEFAHSHRSLNSQFSISSGASGSTPSSPPRAASPPVIETFTVRSGAVSNT